MRTRRAMWINVMMVAGMVSSTALAQAPAANAPVRDTPAWNLADDTLAIQGYDPVAYFPEGGGKAVKGDKKFEHAHNGAKYRFASAAHLERFKANPDRYEPAHGGWCSYAMLDGEKVEVDPKSFIVKNDRLFLFYNGFLADTRSKWQKMDHAASAAKADANWKKISGESPRMTPERVGAAEPTTPAAAPAIAAAPLQPKLDAIWDRAKSGLPAEKVKAYEGGLKQIADSGVAERALKVGATAPDFQLPDSSGSMVSLSSMLKDGPVVVSWYRGAWCPFCNVQLRAYQERLTDIRGLGANFVAISPQTPDNSKETVSKGELTFPVLSDVGNTAARSYGIVHAQPEGARMDLTRFNGSGEGANDLPMPATYVIDRSGKIVYAWTNPDYRQRADPEAVLTALRALR